ncbi:MAG: hypothetical protein ACM3ZE_08030 [Myxococcales bacterium]
MDQSRSPNRLLLTTSFDREMATAAAPSASPSVCGDGVVDRDEECDAASENVAPQDAYNSEACTTLCRKAARCGDRVVDPDFGEQCDGSAACDQHCHTVLTRTSDDAQ